MFAYSLREKTHAHRSLQDDVPEDVKQKRLSRMIAHFLENQLMVSKNEVGRHHLVLVDGNGKKEKQLKGKTDTYRTVVFDGGAKTKAVASKADFMDLENVRKYEEIRKGDYVMVRIDSCTSTSLMGSVVCKLGMNTFFEISSGNPFLEK